MAARKAVRTITISGISGNLVSATVYKGSSVEVDKVAAFGDIAFTSVPRSVKSFDEFQFTILDEGNVSGLSDLVGKVVNVSVSTTYSSGASDSASGSVSCPMVITAASAGGAIEVDGDRKSTVVVTAVPHAP